MKLYEPTTVATQLIAINHHENLWPPKKKSFVDFVYLENEEGAKRGPLILSKELVKVLKVGDTMNVSIGRYDKLWKVLESGNVYAEDTIF